MFSPLEFIRPRVWGHPMVSFEPSLLDFEPMYYARRPRYQSSYGYNYPTHMFVREPRFDVDEFLYYLPVRQESQTQQQQEPQVQEQQVKRQESSEAPPQRKSAPPQVDRSSEGFIPIPKAIAQAEQEQAAAPPAFTTYSFSSSTILDDNGQQVTSTRRRYEDSTGRLKTVHERQIQDRKVRSVWNRKSKDDQGTLKVTCTNGSVDEFEKLWKETSFGADEEKQKTEAIEQQNLSTREDSNTETSGDAGKTEAEERSETSEDTREKETETSAGSSKKNTEACEQESSHTEANEELGKTPAPSNDDLSENETEASDDEAHIETKEVEETHAISPALENV